MVRAWPPSRGLECPHRPCRVANCASRGYQEDDRQLCHRSARLGNCHWGHLQRGALGGPQAYRGEAQAEAQEGH
eukprot:6777951-Alexandrium_andersonii.AAC.1